MVSLEWYTFEKKIQVIAIQVIQVIRSLVLSTMKTPAETLRMGVGWGWWFILGGERREQEVGHQVDGTTCPCKIQLLCVLSCRDESRFSLGLWFTSSPPAPHNAAAQNHVASLDIFRLGPVWQFPNTMLQVLSRTSYIGNSLKPRDIPVRRLYYYPFYRK